MILNEMKGHIRNAIGYLRERPFGQDKIDNATVAWVVWVIVAKSFLINTRVIKPADIIWPATPILNIPALKQTAIANPAKINVTNVGMKILETLASWKNETITEKGLYPKNEIIKIVINNPSKIDHIELYIFLLVE